MSTMSIVHPAGAGLEVTSDSSSKETHEVLSTETDYANDARPTGVKLMFITISLMLAVFCVALDNTVRFPGL